MTIETNASRPQGASRASLIAGVLSIALLIAHFVVTPTLALTLYASLTAGLAGVVLGIVALRKRQIVGVSVAGLIASAVGFLAGSGLLALALAFAFARVL